MPSKESETDAVILLIGLLYAMLHTVTEAALLQKIDSDTAKEVAIHLNAAGRIIKERMTRGHKAH